MPHRVWVPQAAFLRLMWHGGQPRCWLSFSSSITTATSMMNGPTRRKNFVRRLCFRDSRRSRRMPTMPHVMNAPPMTRWMPNSAMVANCSCGSMPVVSAQRSEGFNARMRAMHVFSFFLFVNTTSTTKMGEQAGDEDADHRARGDGEEWVCGHVAARVIVPAMLPPENSRTARLALAARLCPSRRAPEGRPNRGKRGKSMKKQPFHGVPAGL